jgi:hypothetical protein
MTFIAPAYHYEYSRLDQYLSNDYDPLEVADRLRETRLALSEALSKKEEGGRDWKLLCYYLLYDLEDIFRTLKPSADGD